MIIYITAEGPAGSKNTSPIAGSKYEQRVMEKR
jgi:hypothetical protein